MSDINWPEGFPRTAPHNREPNLRYEVTLSQALDDLEDELDRLADNWRLSTAAPQRNRDNRPYANASPEDPGAVIRWQMDDDQYAIACDAYSRLRDNVRTIGLYVQAKRDMEQRPVVTGQSEFANARLPAGDEEGVFPPAEQLPHEILQVAPDADPAVIRAAARRRAAEVHPDKPDGNREAFKRVQEAKEAMLDDL